MKERGGGWDDREGGILGGDCVLQFKHTCPKGRGKKPPRPVVERGGGGTCSSQAQGGREGATHVLRRGGGDRRDTGRQRKQRAEKCGFYLTAFVILPRHAKEIFACVRERKRERERETINRRWGAIVGHREKGERGEGQEGRVNTRKHFSVRITDQRCVLVFFSHNTQTVPC